MKNYIFCGIAAIFLLAACSKSSIPSYPTNWTKNWPEDSKPAYYDSLSKVYYELQRDENNIYLHLNTKELASQFKIMRHGLSIWLDPSAQKKDKQGFVFPQAVPDSAAGSGMGGRYEGGKGEAHPEGAGRPTGPPTAEQMQQRMLQRSYKRFSERPKEMAVVGFDGSSQKKIITLGKDVSDIQVDMEIAADNTLHYYAIIPIKKIFAAAKTASDKLSVGIVSGYLQRDENAGSSFGGGGGQRSGNELERNARREMMMKMMEQMATPIEIWFNADLKGGKKD